MVVQHNMQAMNANRTLSITTGAQAKSTEKLSSGYKINRAADDAAGLSISEKMRRQIRGLDRASTNAQDGISSVQTAEGALNEVHDMLQRMNELANQAANGTNSANDRQSIQDEISQLNTEIDRVAETTKFNETYLLKGDAGTKEITLKAHDAGLKGTLSDMGTKAQFSIELKTDSDISISSHNYHIYDDNDKIEAFQGKVDAANKVSINGTEYSRTNPLAGSGTDVTAIKSVADLRKSAGELQSRSVNQSSAAAVKEKSSALKNGSAATKKASAEIKKASAEILKASASKKEVCVSKKQACSALKAGSAAIKQSSADAITASATKLSKQAEGKNAAADELEINGGAASAIAALRKSAGELSSKSVKQSSAAAIKLKSVAIKTASAATLKASAEVKKASAGVLRASATKKEASVTKKMACSSLLSGSASIKKASAEKITASAEKLVDTADDKLKDANRIERAANKTGAIDTFYADGKEYSSDQVKALIVDGAQVGMDGVAARTAVDTKNNKNNITMDQAQNLVRSALLQANQIGADNETNVSVTRPESQGDNFTYTITKGTVEVANAKSFELQVGADADLTNKITVDIETMNSKYLGVQNLNVVDDTGVAATYAIDAIEDALTKVSEQRSSLGAVQNRLEHTITNLDNVVENTQSAESEIRDTDIADEMVRYSKNNILSQAGQSMLAQANQSTQGALSLLG